MNKICLTLVMIFCATGTSALAAADIKNNTNITVDFQGKQIQFYGIYAPEKSNSRAQGLDAEIVARRNGIAHLNTNLMASCGTTGEKTAAPSWQGVVKSQGSEIFANGVLKISLVAPIKDVLKETSKKKVQTLKSKEGSPIALRIPKVSTKALKCGMLTVNVAGRTVVLNPLSGSNDSGAKVVNLTVDGNVFKPSSATDLALLENSNLMQSGEDALKDASPSPEAQPASERSGEPLGGSTGASGQSN